MIAKLEEEMREAEEECQKVGNQIHKAEFLLCENKRLFSATYGLVEDERKTPRSPKEDFREVVGTPRTSEKAIRRNRSNSLPRFMTSTAASRQRQSAAEREIGGSSRTMTSGTRSSIQFLGSQSLSYSDLRFKAILRNSTKKSRYGETNTPLTESPRCSGSELRTTSMPRSKVVTSSNPNLRVTLSRHRRRMSDLI
ncbi:hypothetical protein L1049_020162 [Liquidambar formosana]|uniref:Uncharacterized protein n=1 Tax=Liquidambar formosana TaxID=63359 RepID=A0AAP0S712_LIQFO